MSKMSDACINCEALYGCYYNDFSRCPKIEIATGGLGVPCKPKQEEPYIKNIPFGVYMGLKHIVNKSLKNKFFRSPVISVEGMDSDGDNIYSNIKNPRDYFNENTDKANIFINRLSMETVMSREDCSSFVSEILQLGNIDDAIKIYDEYSYEGLSNYMLAIQYPAMRKE